MGYLSTSPQKPFFEEAYAVFTLPPRKPKMVPGSPDTTPLPVTNGPCQVDCVVYNRDGVTHYNEVDVNNLPNAVDSILWIAVRGTQNSDVINSLAMTFDLHALLMEDVQNTAHRPKVEPFADHMFFILKRPRLDDQLNLKLEQVSLIMGKNWLISFQHEDAKPFHSIHRRLDNPKARLRKFGTDYLAYAIMDTLIDHYYPLLERMDLLVEDIDHQLMDSSLENDLLDKISLLKRILLILWKVLWAMRDIASGMVHNESGLVAKKNHVFLRDIGEHISHQVELTDMLRLRLDDLGNLYLNRITLRTNEIMKTLTIVGAIFIPLTFIAGVYGMNFHNMPELQSDIGYPIVMVFMVSVAAGLLVYFKRREWL